MSWFVRAPRGACPRTTERVWLCPLLGAGVAKTINRRRKCSWRSSAPITEAATRAEMIRGASDRGWKGAAGRRSSAWPALHDREQDPDRRTGRAAEHLSRVVSTAVQTLKRLPNSLRLLIVFAIQPHKPATARWRPLSAASARWRWKVRKQIALAPRRGPAQRNQRTSSHSSHSPPSTSRSSPRKPTPESR